MATPLSAISKVIIWLIRTYQIIVSPIIGSHCRFRPTCSQYAIEAIYRFNILQGSWLLFKRLLKCHPFNLGGDDAVPKKNL
ncbi:conserved hypothetical protein YidD [secondary endosymbiont of Heteropsylla cubana]|uniref:Putative membrane protein insertion efficiency factor n=1 Tax=secondary endosymbiont of Heteropsylla cubana TaxID=134287 RepID=J3TYV9_9ENTR|nr:membrane protein insertion efficiency factor YidD [secondary endosymbiont of Heteropsylla cubana]AFP85615.1 conserved hypothetical protein YidD [secondary endosymbiont of Heteropsylla cubana]